MKLVLSGILCTAGVGLLLAQFPLREQVTRATRPEIVPDLSRDIVRMAPHQCTVELENDQVRVLRTKLGPNDSLPVHDAKAGILVAVSEVQVRIERPDRRGRAVNLLPGTTQWVFEDAYAVRNAGNRTVEYLFIEMKAKRTAR
jgi:hypothetical protein